LIDQGKSARPEVPPELLAHAMLGFRAGQLVLRMQRAGCASSRKGDGSIVTEADTAAEALIDAGLAQIAPGIAIVGEEAVAEGRSAAAASLFYLLDPIDGTNGFAEGLPEYTVNIGRVRDGIPDLGVVCAPAEGLLYAGLVGVGAFVWRHPIGAEDPGVPQRIAVRAKPPLATALVSRSNRDAPTEAWLKAAGPLTLASRASSLKFTDIAEGKADLYPRLCNLHEWDAAAGHAVLLAAGGRVNAADGGKLVYGRDHGFLMRPFIAQGG
jgi:3'(2'), 5'-bisphosphate nucleotidase